MGGARHRSLRLLGMLLALVAASGVASVVIVAATHQASPPCLPSGGSLCPARLSKVSPVPVSTGPGISTNAVTVLTPDAATNGAFDRAFEAYASLGACRAVVAPHTEHEARIDATGVLIAVAGFEPAPSCRTLYHGPATDAGPFSPRSPVEYLLRDDEGVPGRWTVELDAGIPFPCRPQPGVEQYVPTDVVKAWQLRYYPSACRPVYTGR